jgi:hypothetical protein
MSESITIPGQMPSAAIPANAASTDDSMSAFGTFRQHFDSCGVHLGDAISFCTH